MTVKLLEIHVPWIAAYPTHAHSLSILGNNSKSNEWFYENYVQLVAQPNRTNVFNSYVNYYPPYPWSACPALESSDIPTSVVQLGWKHFYDFAIDLINEGYYLIAYLDRYYLNGLSAYKQNHYAHDTMIYGYDCNARVLYTKDYFDGKYKTMTFSFEDIDNSFRSNEYSKEKCNDFRGLLILKAKDMFLCSFNMEKYKKNIRNYLSSSIGDICPAYGYKEHNFLYPNEYIYGKSIFDMLYRYLKTKKTNNDFNIDIRGFCTIYEYAQIISLATNFIEEKYNVKLCTQQEKMLVDATLLKNLILLSCQTHNKERLDTSMRLVNELSDLIEAHYQTILDTNFSS